MIDNIIIDSRIVPTNKKGHGTLVAFLKDNGGDILICGGIGEGSQSALSSYNIKFYGGVKGDCDDNHLCGSCERTHLKRSL